jgi:hypothetical protein
MTETAPIIIAGLFGLVPILFSNITKNNNDNNNNNNNNNNKTYQYDNNDKKTYDYEKKNKKKRKNKRNINKPNNMLTSNDIKDLCNIMKKKNTYEQRMRVNKDFINMQYHKDYYDTITAINNITPNKELFNMGFLPVVITDRNPDNIQELEIQIIYKN